jgi:O-antigen ligase
MNHDDLYDARSANVESSGRLRLLLDSLLLCALMVALTPNSAAYIVQNWTGLLIAPGPIAALIVAVVSLYFYSTEPRVESGRRFIYISAITILYFCFTGLWSASRIYLATKIFYTATLAPTMLIAGLVIGNSPLRISRLFKVLIGFGIVLCLTAFVFGIDEASEYDAFDLSTAHAGYQGISRMLGLSVCAVLAKLFSRQTTSYQRFVLLLIGLMFGAILLQTGGRTGIAIVLGFVLFYGLARLKLVGRIVLISITAVTVIISRTEQFSTYMLNLTNDEGVPNTIKRVSFYLSPLGESYKYEYSRVFFHKLAAEMFWEHPFLGIGWAGFPVYAGYGDVDYVYPHNLIYEIACETGVFGLVLLAAFLGGPIVSSLKIQRRDGLLGAATGFFGAGIAVAMVVSDFSTQRELLLFVGLLSAFSSGTTSPPIVRPWPRENV